MIGCATRSCAGPDALAPRMPPVVGSPSETWMPVISLSTSLYDGPPRESNVAEASRPSASQRTARGADALWRWRLLCSAPACTRSRRRATRGAATGPCPEDENAIADRTFSDRVWAVCDDLAAEAPATVQASWPGRPRFTYAWDERGRRRQSCRNAVSAALKPHIPCTPPPGGVEDEQR